MTIGKKKERKELVSSVEQIQTVDQQIVGLTHYDLAKGIHCSEACAIHPYIVTVSASVYTTTGQR